MTLRTGIACVLLICGSPALAQHQPSLLGPPLVPPPVSRQATPAHGRDVKIVVGVGIALLTIGYATSALASMDAQDNLHRGLAIVPVVGPIASLSQENLHPGWAAPLLISLWGQLAGGILLGAAADVKYREASEGPYAE